MTEKKPRSKWAIHPQYDERGKVRCYWARISLGRDAQGKQHQKRLTAPTRKALEAKIGDELAAAGRGVASDPTLTVEQFFNRWLAVQGSKAGQTQLQRRWMVEQHIIPALGQVRLSKLTGLQLAELEEARRVAGWSPATVRILHSVLSAALRQAVRWGVISRNPLDGVEPPRVPERPLVVWTAQQAQAFLQATAEDRYGPAYALLLATGIRVGELVVLRWEDVDWDEPSLLVRRTESKDAKRQRTVGETTKGRRARRVPLLPVAVQALETQRARMKAAGRISPWIFPSAWTGGPIGTATIRRTLDLAIAAYGEEDDEGSANSVAAGGAADGQQTCRAATAKLPRLTPHGLRHSCATLLVELGVHPRFVADLLGHRQIAMTERYWHTTSAQLQAAVTPLDAVLSPRPEASSGEAMGE